MLRVSGDECNHAKVGNSCLLLVMITDVASNTGHGDHGKVREEVRLVLYSRVGILQGVLLSRDFLQDVVLISLKIKCYCTYIAREILLQEEYLFNIQMLQFLPSDKISLPAGCGIESSTSEN